MDTRIRVLITLIAIVSFFTGVTCKKNCLRQTYSFNIGVKATPDMDSVLRGDTIWLTIDEPTTLKDGISGNQVLFTNANNLGTVLAFQEVLSATQFREAVIDFDFKLSLGLGTNNNTQLFKEYLFSELGNKYVFKLGIVPRTIGVYRLLFSNAANVYRNNSNCEYANVVVDFKNTDQHYYLHPGYSGNPPTSSGVYYFKVK
jgi:hypothetical protein